MAASYTHTNRPDGTVIDALIYNGDHQNHIDHMTPSFIDDHASTLAQFRALTSPGSAGSESLPVNLGGDLERLRFVIKQIKDTLGGASTYWYDALNVKGVVALHNIKSYGAVGDGVTDDSTAFTSALTAASTNGVVYIPTGTFYIPTFASLSTGKCYIFGDGPDKSILLAKKATNAESGGHKVSHTILKLSSLSGICIRDVRFDGNMSAPDTDVPASSSTQTYLGSLLDIRDSSRIALENVIVTKYLAQPGYNGSGLYINPIETAFNEGPIFIYNSSQIYVHNCKLLTPSFHEGLTFVNVQQVVVDKFYSNAGYDSHAIVGTSSPLRILGPTTAQVAIINSTFYNANGLGINLGGDTDFLIQGCHITGATAAIDDPARAGRAGGLNINKAITKDLSWTIAHPNMKHIRILNNIFRENSGELINIGGSTVTPTSASAAAFEDVIIEGNEIFNTWQGISCLLVYGLRIRHNSIRKVLQYQASGLYGTAIAAQFSADVIIENNDIDGIETVSYQSATRKHQYNIYTLGCQRLTVQNNKCLDAEGANIYLDTTTADADGTYTRLRCSDNRIDNVAVIPAVPVIIGKDATHRIGTAYIAGNTVNQGPLTGTNSTFHVITPWDERVNCTMRRGTTQTISASDVVTTLICPTAVSDPYVRYNVSTGTYAAPVRGMYQVSFNCNITDLASGRRIQFFLFVNGSSVEPPFGWYFNDTGSTLSPDIVCNATIALAAGDLVTVRCRQNDGATVNLTVGAFFSARCVGYY